MKPGAFLLLSAIFLLACSPDANAQERPPGNVHERIAAIERIPPEQRTASELVQLGRDYRLTGQLDDALVQARAALRLDVDNSNALLLLGDLQFQRQEYRQALASFDRVAQLRPGFPAVQLRRSQVLSALGLGREADAANALYLTRRGRARAATPDH